MKKVIVYIIFGLLFLLWAAIADNKNMENIHGNLGLLLLVMALAESW